MRIQATLTIFMMLLIFGCVGTVQDATQSFSKINEAPKNNLTFAGVANVVAISDSRIEVFFYPATGGSGKYNYDVMIGNEPFPITTPSEVLKPDFRGLLKITLTGLSRLTSYQIKVEVRDKDSSVPSNSGIIKTVSTFGHLVADFNGISSAFNTPGQDGKDSIKVRWTPSRTSGSLSPREWDPKTYEIVLVDAEKLTPLDMDLPYTPAQGRWVYGLNHNDTLNEFVVRGLPSKTKFYVRMRCLHTNSVEDVYDLTRRGEMNTNYVMITTLSDDLADIDFQGASFSVALAPGEQGLNAVYGTWGKAAGVFDHFRIYYGETGALDPGNLPDLCLTPLVSPVAANTFCKRAAFDADNSPVTGLEAYTSYDMVLVLCANTQCEDGKRILSPVRTIVTDPALPSFSGIKGDILTAANLSEIGTLRIKFDPPNFLTGYFDGLTLKMSRLLDGTGEIEITELTNPVYHSNYNFLTDTEIIINGVNYLDPAPYCFTLYPFKWDTDGVTKIESPNGILRCANPKPVKPTVEEFPGLDSVIVEQDLVTLSWTEATGGIFSHYEIIWSKPHVPIFNWGIAIPEITNFNYSNYGRQLVPAGTNSYVMNNFADGDYVFGVITYYTYVTNSGNVILRSETNEKKFNCTIDNSNPLPVDCTP